MDVQTQVAVFQCVLAAVAAAIPAAVRSFVFFACWLAVFEMQLAAELVQAEVQIREHI